MGIVRFSAIALAILVLLTSGLQASGFENSGVGTKARGMGGAFRAVADDWTAAYYNPAGYANIWDNQLGANLAFVHYRNEIIPDYRWDGVYETGMFNDKTNYNAHEILSNPSAGFIVRFPVWGETVFGLSAYQPFDYNITWEMFEMLPAYNSVAGLPGDQFRNNLDVVAFQLTAAREFIEDELSLGIGVQLLRADLLYTNIFFRENPLSSSDDPTYDDFADRPYDRIPQWSRNDGFGYGFGLRAGMLWKASEKVDIGATIALPFPITVTGDVENRFYMPDNPTLWQQLPDVYRGTVEHLFLSGQTVIHRASFEAKLDLPPSIGLGMAYKASEKLTVTVDAEYTLWSQYEGLEFTYTDHVLPRGPADTSVFAREFFTDNVSAPVEWDNAGKFMLGAAYDYADYLTLLGGVSLDQSPARNAAQFTPQFIDTGNKKGLNLGCIVHIDRWDLGFVTSYQSQPDMNIDGFAGLDAGTAAQRFPAEYKAATYETILSFNYRF